MQHFYYKLRIHNIFKNIISGILYAVSVLQWTATPSVLFLSLLDLANWIADDGDLDAETHTILVLVFKEQ